MAKRKRSTLPIDGIARVVASLDEVVDVPLRALDTPMEEFLANELRQTILTSLPKRVQQMLFLLMEYGFTPREIGEAMCGLKDDTLRGYVYQVRHVARNVLKARYTLE